MDVSEIDACKAVDVSQHRCTLDDNFSMNDVRHRVCELCDAPFQCNKLRKETRMRMNVDSLQMKRTCVSASENVAMNIRDHLLRVSRLT